MSNLFPELYTSRLDLVEIKQEHLHDIFKLFGDARVTQFYNIVTLEDESGAQKIIDWFKSRFENNVGIRWGISLKGNNNVIGTVGFNNYAKHHRANIGYDLQPGFWNKGIMTEALRAVIAFGFKQLEINRMEAEVMQGNVVSENLLTKLGFKNEGILRQWMFWNDRHHDMTMYSLLKSDFLP